jgi:hypothetical protein
MAKNTLAACSWLLNATHICYFFASLEPHAWQWDSQKSKISCQLGFPIHALFHFSEIMYIFILFALFLTLHWWNEIKLRWCDRRADFCDYENRGSLNYFIFNCKMPQIYHFSSNLYIRYIVFQLASRCGGKTVFRTYIYIFIAQKAPALFQK